MAHGGFCVARHEGRAVFVRHTLPGERVRATVTEGGTEDTYWRADAVEILEAAPGRVVPPCPWAGPGRCGGCDWQHASPDTQRALKAAVVSEQLQRLAGLAVEVVVEPVPGDDGVLLDGLGWRTRVGYAVDASGRAGLRASRSHEVVPVDRCLIAAPGVRSLGVEARSWASSPGSVPTTITAVASSEGERTLLVSSEGGGDRVVEGPAVVHEHAAGRRWQVAADGFWQVHPGAAHTLATAVLEALDPQPGERALDLYAGVGLFAGAVGVRVGETGSVLAVESSRSAVADARVNLADLPWVEVVAGRVDRVLAQLSDVSAADLVVLDPPRTGAKAAVVKQVARRRPRAIAYVACDPAALARDLAGFAAHGYRLATLQAFDLFPMTHHVECLALLRPTSDATGSS